jgi:hypothetical protein
MNNGSYTGWVIEHLPDWIANKFSISFRVNSSRREGFELRFKPVRADAPTLIYGCSREQIWDDIEPNLELYLPSENRRIQVPNPRYSLEEMLTNFAEFDLVEVEIKKQSLLKMFTLIGERQKTPGLEGIRDYVFENDKIMQSSKVRIIRRYRHW